MPLKDSDALEPEESVKETVEVVEAEERPGRGDMPEWLPWLVIAAPVAVLLTLITVRFLSAITGVLTLLVFAEFIALALEPGVNWLARRGWRRGAATGLLMAVVIGVMVGAFVLVIPTFVSQLVSLFERLPGLVADLSQRLNLDISTADIQSAINDQRANLAKLADDLAANVLNITSSVLGTLGSLATVLLLAFYLTAEAPKVRRTVLSLFPRPRQADLLRLWEISIDKVGGYLYSRALMGILSGSCSYVVMRILGVPFAAPLAIFVGFVSQFVPVVGTYIAYALPSLIALASEGLGDVIVIVVFAVLYQQIENLFISPRLSARTMKLHPAVAFVAALIGGSLGGVTWAFLALPVAAIFQAFISTFLTRYEVIASDLTRDEPVDPDRVERKSSMKLRLEHMFRQSGRQPSSGSGDPSAKD
jgi:predicted PurR-regulated permease PerM